MKNCDQGLVRPQVAFSSPRSQLFTIWTNLKPANNMFIFFSCSKLVLQITKGFVYGTLVIQWACTPSTYGGIGIS